MKVVSIVISTSAEKVVGDRIGFPANVNVAPIPAKIRPTSPCGIIPTPMASRSRPRPRTPRPQICLPAIATSVINAAKPSTAGEAKLFRSTV